MHRMLKSGCSKYFGSISIVVAPFSLNHAEALPLITGIGVFLHDLEWLNYTGNQAKSQDLIGTYQYYYIAKQ